VTGIATIFIGPLVGKAADSFGKLRVFLFGTAVMIVMVLIYTHLSTSTLAVVTTINVVLFVGIFSRMIPFQALMSQVPAQTQRGSFNASTRPSRSWPVACIPRGRTHRAGRSGWEAPSLRHRRLRGRRDVPAGVSLAVAHTARRDGASTSLIPPHRRAAESDFPDVHNGSELDSRKSDR
jgi:hypothetical protein